LNKEDVYEFLLGPYHLISGYRLNIYVDNKMFDYVALGTDSVYVNNYVLELVKCFKENEYKIK
jgi:hypothetical protein